MGFGWQEIVVVLLVAGVLYALFLSAPGRRRLRGWTEDEVAPAVPLAAAPEPAEAILEARFARGEIDATEFETKRAILRKGKG